jgi:hypothetical protein
MHMLCKCGKPANQSVSLALGIEDICVDCAQAILASYELKPIFSSNCIEVDRMRKAQDAALLGRLLCKAQLHCAPPCQQRQMN